MLSRFLYPPLVLILIVLLYLLWEVDDRFSWYLIPVVILLAMVYILSPQIDFWWSKRYPPDLDPPLRRLLERSPFYSRLAPENRKKFRDRVALFMQAKDFKGQNLESIPEDIKAVVAAAGVQVTFDREEYLLPAYETIIFYPHPFPSPQFPQHWHISEIFDEDGVILLSAEHVLRGFLEPKRYFNVALYEMARAASRNYPDFKLPDIGWSEIEIKTGIKKADLIKYHGLPELEPGAVSLCFE